MRRGSQRKGFTLLEILLVIAAIGILAAIVLIAINPNKQLAQDRDTARQSDINTIQKALDQYLIETRAYPNTVSNTPGYICNTGTEQVGGSTNCSGRIDLRELVPTYIAGIPRDPQATGNNTGYNVVINPNNNKIGISADFAERKSISINPHIVTSGLVLNLDAGNTASYPGTGTTWTDLSGNGRNYTLGSNIQWNSAGFFEFTGGTAVGPASNSFNFNNNVEHTILAFIKINNPIVTNTLFRWVATTESDNRAIMTHFPWTDGSLYYDVGGCCGSLSRISSFTGDDYFLSNIGMATWRTRTDQYPHRQFFNNTNSVLDSGTNNTPTVNWNLTDNAIIGNGWNGNIYVFMVYNRALTDSEIQQNYNALRGRYGL